MDRIAFMKAYCRIVELGSLSAAATDIGLSASQLSRELKAEEDSLGTSLINRNTRALSPTEDGQYYYDEARRLVGELHAFDDHMRQGRKNPHGVLRVNAPLTFGVAVLAPLLPEFRHRYPKIDVALSLNDHVIDMVEGGFDLSIRVRATLPDSGLRAKKLATYSQKLCAAPEYLSANDALSHPEDLANHDLISFTLTDPPGLWKFTRNGEEVLFPVKAGLAVNNSIFIAEMAVAGQGIASLPGFIADPLINNGKLAPVLADWSMTDRHAFCLSASRSGHDGKSAVFVEYLQQALQG